MRSKKDKKRSLTVKTRAKAKARTRAKSRARAKAKARTSHNRGKTRRLAGAPSRTFMKDFYIKYSRVIKEREKEKEARENIVVSLVGLVDTDSTTDLKLGHGRFGGVVSAKVELERVDTTLPQRILLAGNAATPR